MHNELTQGDIDKMKEELNYRRTELRPKLLENVKTARAFGDLSENFEYKEAKREKNRNESRIRYLDKMIRSAVVVREESGSGIGLYDTVTVRNEESGTESVYRIVTTLRQDVLNGLISNESPMGRALMKRNVGDRVTVQVSESYSYPVTILKVEKNKGDGNDIPISPF